MSSSVHKCFRKAGILDQELGVVIREEEEGEEYFQDSHVQLKDLIMSLPNQEICSAAEFVDGTTASLHRKMYGEESLDVQDGIGGTARSMEYATFPLKWRNYLLMKRQVQLPSHLSVDLLMITSLLSIKFSIVMRLDSNLKIFGRHTQKGSSVAHTPYYI